MTTVIASIINEGSRSSFGEHCSSNTPPSPPLFRLSLCMKVTEGLILTKKEFAAAAAAAAATRLEGTKHQRLGLDAHGHCRDSSSNLSFITHLQHTAFKTCFRLYMPPPAWLATTCLLLFLQPTVVGCTRKSTGLDLGVPCPPSLPPSLSALPPSHATYMQK